MFIIENYGFFIFMVVIIYILYYFHTSKKIWLHKNITEEFSRSKAEPFKDFANVTYLDSCARLKDYLTLQKTLKRYELPFNWNNEGYISFGPTPLAPIQSMPTLNFHTPYGPKEDVCC